MHLRQLLIKYILPLRWNYFKQSKLTALQGFAMTELDSGWQSLYAMDFIDDPKARAALFMHAMEEIEHSSLFNNLCRYYSEFPLETPIARRKVILNQAKKDSILDFFCYMHVGESTVNEDFKLYSRAPIDPKIQNLFKKISKDEESHEKDSIEFIHKIANNNIWKIKRYVLFNQIGRAFRQFTLLSSKLGEAILSLLLSCIYFCFGFIYLKTFRGRINLSQVEQFNILKKQISAFLEKNQ